MIGLKKFYNIFALPLFYLLAIHGSPTGDVIRENGLFFSGISNVQCTSNNECAAAGLNSHQCCWSPGHGKVCTNSWTGCFESPLSSQGAGRSIIKGIATYLVGK